MKFFLFFAIIFLTGCASAFIKTPVPETPLDMQSAARTNGVIEPYQFDFTMITQYQGQQVRAVILAEPAFKLADMTVYKDKTELHYKVAQVPQKLLKIWVSLIRENFFTACPQREIFYREGKKIIVQAQAAGGICR